jgi:hypothetical protein
VRVIQPKRRLAIVPVYIRVPQHLRSGAKEVAQLEKRNAEQVWAEAMEEFLRRKTA